MSEIEEVSAPEEVSGPEPVQPDLPLSTTIIDVPPGLGVIRYFELSPQLPQAGTAVAWPLVETGPEQKPTTGNNLNKIDIRFSDVSIIQPNAREWELSEMCILVININPRLALDWRFAFDGVEPNLAQNEYGRDFIHNIKSTVMANGRTLKVTIQSITKGVENEQTGFRFVAAHTNAHSLESSTYASTDPGIRVQRGGG